MPANEELARLVADALRLEDAAEDDPESEPFKSRYAARALLAQALATLEAEGVSEGVAADPVRRRLQLTWLRVRVAANQLETEEASEAHRTLTQLTAEDPEPAEDEKVPLQEVSVQLQALNWLGCASCHLGRHAEAISQLKRAEASFLQAKRLMNAGLRQADDCGDTVWGLADVFPAFPADLRDRYRAQWDIDSLHTRTLFYLAQACGKIDRPADSARYCLMTLERQLALAEYAAGDWSLNCAALSQYYLGVRDFPRAHRCLCAASAIFAEAAAAVSEEAMSTHDPDSELQRSQASIRRCWVKYALALLEHSRDLLTRQLASLELGQAEAGQEPDEYEDLFPTVDGSQHAGKVAHRPAVNFDQARPIFLFAQTQIGLAKEFFRLDEHCSDHVELVRDHSRAYLHLIQFELDRGRRARMHKRRADMLGQLLGQLSPQFYLLVCRQLRFELAETLTDMADIKLEALQAAAAQEAAAPPPGAVAKANKLAHEAIAQFELFVDSFRSAPPASQLPDRFEAMDERPVLLAQFHAGRLAAKLLEARRERRLQNLRKTEDCYASVIRYCDTWPEAAAKMAPELGLLRDMLALMPVKIRAAMDKFHD